MKKLLITAVILIPLSGFGQKLTNANEVINRYLEVTKLKENASKIQDMTFSYTTESPRGVAESEFKYIFPFKFSMSVFANGMEIMTQKYDGTKLERKSNFGGQNQAPKSGYEAFSEANRFNPFIELDYKTANFTPTLLASEDASYYIIEVKDSLNKSWKDYYNVATGFKDKSISIIESPKGSMENTIVYENYKAFKGSEILFAAVKKQIGKMGEIVSELQSIKFNKGLKPKDFEIK